MGERIWRGCAFPEGLLYDVERNVWVRLEGDEAVLGMTDVAQTLGGKMVHVSWKPVSRTVAQGRPLAVIESAKWVGPFPAPFSGEIVATNHAAFDADILVANRDPYGAGWLVRLRPSDLASQSDHLVDAAAAFARYRTLIDEQDIHCYRCVDEGGLGN